MKVIEQCPRCETMLEVEVDGQRVRFTAHDDAFCAGATYMLLEATRRALRMANEQIAHLNQRLCEAFGADDGELPAGAIRALVLAAGEGPVLFNPAGIDIGPEGEAVYSGGPPDVAEEPAGGEG